MEIDTIGRDDVAWRLENVWPMGEVEYAQDELHEPDRYRQDCSGYACMGVALPLDYPGSWGGLSTVTMVTSGLWVQLGSWDYLQRADVVMIGGAGTGGNAGHVMTFDRWYNTDPNDSRAYIWEQAGGSNQPVHRLVDLAGANRQGYLPYRCTFVVDGSAPAPEPPPGEQLRRPWPSYMPFDQWFGNINGPDASHGGYYPNERADVAAIQGRLAELGYAEVGPADGVFGPRTISAVTRWQRDRYASLTTYYGQVWADDWTRLFTY